MWPAVSTSATNKAVTSPTSVVTVGRDVAVEPRGEDLAEPADEGGSGRGADRIAMRAARRRRPCVLQQERHQLVAGADAAAVDGLVAEGLDVEHAGAPPIVEDERHDGLHGRADLRRQVGRGIVEGADEVIAELVEQAVVDGDHERVEVVEALVEVARVEVVGRADGTHAGPRPALAGEQVEGGVEQQLDAAGRGVRRAPARRNAVARSSSPSRRPYPTIVLATGVDNFSSTSVRAVVDGRIVVIGSGIGGLSTALALGRAGHEVLVLDRDPLPTSGDVEEAFAADRRGAPQVHQTHGFLARLVVEMRRHFPDVLAALYDVGCMTVPARNNLGDPQPGDEDLVVLIVRRTTLEWLFREAALAQPGVELRPSSGVAELIHHVVDGVPVVDGVRLEDGTEIAAALVVDASGRRSTVPALLGQLGVDIDEQVHESGLMYLSRWYRVPERRRGPARREARRRSRPPQVPRRARRRAHALHHARCPRRRRRAAGLPLRPGGVRAGGADARGTEPLLRRRAAGADRRRPSDGRAAQPDPPLPRRRRRAVVLGLHAVGDSHTCTNPLYGRGCSLALVQSLRLADAIADHGDDAVARAQAYEAACRREIEPWYHSSVEMDVAGSDPGTDGDARAAAEPDGPRLRRRRDRPRHRPGADAA